jgi:hypothetical protein
LIQQKQNTRHNQEDGKGESASTVPW